MPKPELKLDANDLRQLLERGSVTRMQSATAAYRGLIKICEKEHFAANGRRARTDVLDNQVEN